MSWMLLSAPYWFVCWCTGWSYVPLCPCDLPTLCCTVNVKVRWEVMHRRSVWMVSEVWWVGITVLVRSLLAVELIYFLSQVKLSVLLQNINSLGDKKKKMLSWQKLCWLKENMSVEERPFCMWRVLWYVVDTTWVRSGPKQAQVTFANTCCSGL